MERTTEFQRKIQNYSKPTLQKIIHSMTSLERFHKIREAVVASKTEEEVVEKLNSL